MTERRVPTKRRRKVYHITDKRNLPSIAKLGLNPHQDNSIASEEVRKGKVTNVLLDLDRLDFMVGYFRSRAFHDFDYNYSPVLLSAEVEEEKVQVVHKRKVDFTWGLIWESIPSEDIEIESIPIEGREEELIEVKENFRKGKEATA